MISFNYIGYSGRYEDVHIQKLYSNKETLFVFQDRKSEAYLSKIIKNDIFSGKLNTISIVELKDNIFLPDKTILREAKRIISLFLSLTNEVKSELNVKSYFDIIDFANNFFFYYKVMDSFVGKKSIKIQSWQKKEIKLFEKIKINYDKYIFENNFIPNDWIEKKEYLDQTYLLSFKNIVFLDVVDFPEYYSYIFEKISNEVNINIILQLEKENFNEQKLCLEKFDIPRNNLNIEVEEFNSDTEELYTLLSLVNSDNYEVFSPIPERKNFSNIFSKYFHQTKIKTLNESKIYKFMELQLEILNSSDNFKNDMYDILVFKSALESPVFMEYYGLCGEDIKILSSIISDEYRYISKELVDNRFQGWYFQENEEFIIKMKKVFSDLQYIVEIQSIDDILAYFSEKTDLTIFDESTYENLFDKFYEAIGMMTSNENLFKNEDLNVFFPQKVGINSYKLLLKYMDNIELSSKKVNNFDRTYIRNIDIARFSKKEENKKAIYLDLTSNVFPKNEGAYIIFTEKQKRILALQTKDEKSNIEKYRFFQSFFSFNKVIVILNINKEENIERSPFLEEIIFKNGIVLKEKITSNNNIIESIKRNFISESVAIMSDDPNKNKENNYNLIKKESTDFKDFEIRIGAYDYSSLNGCELKFYFNKISKLQMLKDDFEEGISSKLFGIITHNSLERIIKSNWKNILETNKIDISVEDIGKHLNYEFEREKYKISNYIKPYINGILIPILSKNIRSMFLDITKRFENIKIKKFQSEYSVYKDEPFYEDDFQDAKIKFKLSGRSDLVIEAENINEVIDYKTGNSTADQLAFYTIMIYGDENKADKYVYNLWKGETKKFENVKLTTEDLKENLKNFILNEHYEVASAKSTCNLCEFTEICDRGKKSE